MTAYAIAHLRPSGMNEEIVEYIERIQGTMDPFGGRFLVHMAEVEIVEGEWPGAVVVLEFPRLEAIRAWYASADYQDILPLRTRHLTGDVIMVDGVPPGYDARQTAASLREAIAAS